MTNSQRFGIPHDIQRVTLWCCVNYILNTIISCSTHRELRERRPWKASEASSDIWLLLKSLRGTEQKKKKEKRNRETQNHRHSVSEGVRNTESETQRSTQATNRIALAGCTIHVSPHLLTSCATSYKEKRPQLGSPWWRSAPVVWNQTYT